MLLSLSHQRTLTYLDCLGEGHDAVVLQWKSDIEKKMILSREKHILIFSVLLTVLSTVFLFILHVHPLVVCAVKR